MTTPPTDGTSMSDPDARWADPSTPISLDKPAVVEEPFNPYRFGAPEHPVPPEYAPPGYLPPAPPVAPPLATQPPPYPPAYYPPQQYPYAAAPQPPYAQARPRYGKAIAALVLGILSIVFCFMSLFDLVLIIPAIVFGSLGVGEAKRSGGAGRALALTGVITAVIGALLAVTITIWLYPKVARCVNDYPQGSTEYNNCIRDIVS